MQISAFQTDDSQPPTNGCVDLMLTTAGQKTTPVPRFCTCERCGTTVRGRECCTGHSEFCCSAAKMRSSRNVVSVAAGISSQAGRAAAAASDEYGLDNHYATAPSHESHKSSNWIPPSTSYSHCSASSPIVLDLVDSKLLMSSHDQPTMAWPCPGAPAIVATSVYKAISLSNGKDKSYTNDDLIATGGNSTAHMRDNGHSHYHQQSDFQLWKCLKTACECVCLFEKMLLLVLIVGVQKIKKSDVCCFDDNECVDSGGSSLITNQAPAGGSSSSGSGSGKKQQNTNSNRSGSSSSSSQRSGSGSSQRGGGGTGMGGGRRLGGGSSGDSSDDDDDDDHNRRPRQQLNKEPKSKPEFDDDDDVETDSADEGGDDHSPRDMTLELNSPPSSIQNDNGGGSMSSHGGGMGEGGGEGKSQEGGRRGRNNIGSLPLGSSGGTSSSRFSTTNMSGGATVESITLKEGIAGSAGSGGGRIATTTLISSSQINSPVNMAVGYGVPVLAATDGDGLMTNTATIVSGGALASSSSVPNSELGTPTQDSPSPPPPPAPHLGGGGGRDTPGTPQAMSPEITPNAQVKWLIMPYTMY